MVKYSYVPKRLSDNGFRFDDSTFPEAVYHIIKGFYHIHEFHEDENDSSLSAFISPKDIDIHEPNNAALQHYLKKHESTVLNLVKWGKNLLRTVIDIEKQNQDKTNCPYTRPSSISTYQRINPFISMTINPDITVSVARPYRMMNYLLQY